MPPQSTALIETGIEGGQEEDMLLVGRLIRTVIVASLALTVGAPAMAQSRQPPTLEQQADEAARAMRDAIERAMKLLGGVVDQIPQYEMPEILPNGDIIIRRLPPRGAPPRDPPPGRGPDRAPDRSPGGPKLEET